MRVIGMDIHRTFAEVVMIDGDKLIRLGRVTMSREHLAAFAAKLTRDILSLKQPATHRRSWKWSLPSSAEWSLRIQGRCI